MHAGEELGEPLRPDRDHERRADGGVHRVAAADPVPEAEGVGGVDAEVGDLVERGRDRDEVPGHGLGRRRRSRRPTQPVEQPRPAQPRVGERLEGAEGLAGHDEQRGRRVEPGQLLRRVGRVDVADEPALEAVLAGTAPAPRRPSPARGRSRRCRC